MTNSWKEDLSQHSQRLLGLSQHGKILILIEVSGKLKALLINKKGRPRILCERPQCVTIEPPHALFVQASPSVVRTRLGVFFDGLKYSIWGFSANAKP